MSVETLNELLSPEYATTLMKRVESMARGNGTTQLWFKVALTGSANWGRSQMRVNSEEKDVRLRIHRRIRGARGRGSVTNRLDDAGLLEAIRSAESSLLLDSENVGYDNEIDPVTNDPISNPTLWSDATYNLTAQARTELAEKIIEPALSKGLLSAGNLRVSAAGQTVVNSQGLFRYYPYTDVQCSVNVRDKEGTASGWAARHDYDLSKINISTVSNRATDKCARSLNPVRIEPGRYTTILEPQAVADLFAPVMEWPPGGESIAFLRFKAEGGDGPFASQKRSRYSKIGELVLDRRLSVSSDPLDPDAGFIPFSSVGSAYVPVKWIDKGILRELSYTTEYALENLGKEKPLLNSLSYRIGNDGPATSIDEMISSTERGLLVTRFSNIQRVSRDTVLCMGYTRDGVWLIEKGKITGPVKNFRFMESPLFAFNNVEAVGTTERVFSPPFARMAPAIKVRDFNFTSLADAV